MPPADDAVAALRVDPLPDATRPLPFAADAPIFAAFLAQATQAPTATALSWSDSTCTYGELERISMGIAQALSARGVGAGDTVAIFAERSAALVYAMLGVLRAGASFYVADQAYPTPRLVQCTRTLAPKMLLAASTSAVPDAMAALCGGPTNILTVPLAVDAARAAFPTSAVTLPPVSPATRAYAMFTSGTTGQPKAVVTAHAPLVHFVAWHAAQHGFTRHDRFAMLSGLSHDPVLRDIFTPLSIGARVCVPSQGTLFDPVQLAAWLRAHAITVCHLTPALGEVIAEGAELGGAIAALRHLFWGGDVLSANTHARLLQAAPRAQQTNFYGATETPQAMAFQLLPDKPTTGGFAIGSGIADVQLLVMNDDGSRTDVGGVGEVWIRTPYLSLGYDGDDDKTRARFVANPFRNDAHDRCYRTGDRGRVLPDGSVMLVGRADHQLKIRGFRVEPAEVAMTMETQPGVARALVVGVDGASGKALVGYVTGDLATLPSSSDVKEHVRRSLPAYMVPTHVVRLAAFPLLPNGKIDFAQLPPPDRSEASRAPSYAPPVTEKEQQLARIWAEVLGVADVGIDDTFIDLGGDSLSALKVLVRMQRSGLPDHVARGILQGHTIRELAAESDPTNVVGGFVSPQAQTNLLVNIVRGVLVTIVVSEHWLEGFAPATLLALEPYFGPIFNLATPGFALIFGVSLGYSYFHKFHMSPAQTLKSLRLGVALLGASILIGGLVRLSVVPLQAGHITDTDFFMAFFNVLLYYALALSTAPLWFFVLDRFPNPYLGAVALIVGFVVLSAVVWRLIGASEPHGFLYLCKALLVAKFNYFKMSSGVLCGLMAGVYLQRRRAPLPTTTTAAVSAALLSAALVVLFAMDRSLAGLQHEDDMRAWRWIFGAGMVCAIATAATLLILPERVPPRLRAWAQLVGVVGQGALPFFVLHLLVLDVSHFLELAGVPRALAIALPVAGFLAFAGWMVRRLYALYYGAFFTPRPTT